MSVESLKYQSVIGLEVHAQLSTQSKIFSSDAVFFGSEPNTNISAITLAHPGTLPKLNRTAVEYAIKMGLVCHSTISRYTIFDRKNYFYPDLPKGYQLTQDRTPICKGGFIPITLKDGNEKNIALNRIHLEEDAGKLIHDGDDANSLVDLNRAGTALIEIVTEPVLQTSEEVAAFLTAVRRMVRYLNICDGNMEEGSMRCDANVSVKLKDASVLGKKVEIKNMNSIRYVQRAIDFEIERQITELEKGNTIVSETRLFDVNLGKTASMRTKEELNDYRYFPDPDVSPVVVSEEWLNTLRAQIPAMPGELQQKFKHVYGLPDYDAQVLTDSQDTALFFENICAHTTHYKAASNWVMGPIKSKLKGLAKNTSDSSLQPAAIAQLIALVEEGKVSFTAASQSIFEELWRSPQKSPLQVAQELNLVQDSNQESLLAVINEVLHLFPAKAEEYKKGKKGLLAMFMGEIMKRTQGKADPKAATELVEKRLNEI
jgi:aspartyl-tRNA(Asn)/glutamyl-tRNA(Gln) amidotransferase subunit B